MQSFILLICVFARKGFYDEVANVLLSDINFHYPDNKVNSLTNSVFKQLYNGSEIIIAGRLNDIEMNDFPFEVSAQRVSNIISNVLVNKVNHDCLTVKQKCISS